MYKIKVNGEGSQDKYYGKFYSQVVGINTTGILSFFWKYPHNLLEKPFKTNEGFKIIGLIAFLGFVIVNYYRLSIMYLSNI